MFHGFHRITILENDGSQNNNTYSSYVLWSCKVLKVNSYKEVHAKIQPRYGFKFRQTCEMPLMTFVQRALCLGPMCKCYWARGSGRWLSTPMKMMSRVIQVIIYIMPPMPPIPPMPPMPPMPPGMPAPPSAPM